MAAPEIVVTPAMIAAGINALIDIGEVSDGELVSQIYRPMAAVGLIDERQRFTSFTYSLGSKSCVRVSCGLPKFPVTAEVRQCRAGFTGD
jgi:hypothetical protein